MRYFSLAVIATVSSVASAQIASAADMPVKAPVAPAPVAYNWTGFYIGANIGGGWGNRNLAISPNDPTAPFWATFVTNFGGVVNSTPSFKTSGVLGGLQLGYNWQFNRNWLIGFETDFNWANVDGSSLTGTGGTAAFTESFDERIKWFGTVRARLGYLPTDKLLAFITGGFAYGRVEHSANISHVPGTVAQGLSNAGFSYDCTAALVVTGQQPCFAGSSSHTATGWTLGGGLEYALWRNLTLKAEYLYVNLGTGSVTLAATNVLNPGFDSISSFHVDFGRTTINVARVGVNYRF